MEIGDLEQDSFEANEFVERLAWRASGSGSIDDFDAAALHEAFVVAIADLRSLHAKQQRKCQGLEQKCQDEENGHRKRVAALMERNRQTASTYKSLDEKINSVATKVVHLGNQLESVNTPRHNVLPVSCACKANNDHISS